MNTAVSGNECACIHVSSMACYSMLHPRISAYCLLGACGPADQGRAAVEAEVCTRSSSRSTRSRHYSTAVVCTTHEPSHPKEASQRVTEKEKEHILKGQLRLLWGKLVVVCIGGKRGQSGSWRNGRASTLSSSRRAADDHFAVCRFPVHYTIPKADIKVCAVYVVKTLHPTEQS